MKKLFDHLAKSKVTPNGLYVLHAVYNNYSFANYVNFKHEQHKLELNGFMKSSKDDKGVLNYILTKEGLHIIRESTKIIGKIQTAGKKIKVPFSEWEVDIIKFNEMFPKGKRQGSSIPFRTSPKELFERFKWFFLEYPEYTWSDVLYATNKYAEHYDAASDYTYMQSSKYFIKKVDIHKSTTSNLATLCYNIANGDEGDINEGFHYFGS